MAGLRHLRLPCVPESVAQARVLVSAWCHAAGMRGDPVANVKLAVTEAAANAVLHSGCTDFEIQGRMSGGSLIISVTDYGSAREDVALGHGVGIQIIRTLAETVDFERTQSGTSVTMRFDASTL